MSDVINFATPVSVTTKNVFGISVSKHYPGFTVHDGVDLALEDNACVAGSKVITFANAKVAPQNVPHGGQFEVSPKANAKYFQVKPLVTPAV